MSCDRRCFEKEWKYGDIECSDCPGQDSYEAHIKGSSFRKELQIKLDKQFKKVGKIE